jgi:hypothetical protein
LDERSANEGLQTYAFALPAEATTGLYTLSFHLDSFTTASSLILTNLTTGIVGNFQPVQLGIAVTNETPTISFTSPTNGLYLIKQSGDLVNWSPIALMAATNGPVRYTDSPATNSLGRYYRVEQLQ